jgi:predicted dehydrogenase
MTSKTYTPGEGHTFGLGTHSLDQAYVLFGRPKSVTAFFRVQRGIASAVEDSFTIILQYESELLVTVKTCVVSPMETQLKFWMRGMKGSYVKFQARSTCPQEEDIGKGKGPLDAGFAEEEERMRGTVATYEEVDGGLQKYDEESGRYVGRYPTERGCWMDLYRNVAGAIQGKGELGVKAEEVRDVLRIIELARESHEKGVTVAWK